MKITIKKNKIPYLLLALVPMLDVYMTPIPIFTLGEIVLIFIVSILLFTNLKKNNNHQNKLIYLFYIYGIVISLLMYVIEINNISASTIKEFIGFVFYFLLFMVMAKTYDKEYFIEQYVNVSFCVSIFTIIQFSYHFFTNNWIPGIIPGLQSSIGIETNEIIRRMARACGPFTEPAHLCQFLAIPFSYTALKEKYSKFDKLLLIVYFLSLFLSLSGNGLFIILIVIIMWLLKRGNNRQIITSIILLLSVVLLFWVLYTRNDEFHKLINRVNEISGDAGEGNYSGYIRIIRGYIGYINLNLFEQIFGTGIGTYRNIFKTIIYNELSIKTNILIDYVNGFQYYLISFGIIGISIFVSSIIKIVIKEDFFLKTTAILYIGLMLICALYTGWIWLYFLLVLFTKKEKKYDERKTIRYNRD